MASRSSHPKTGLVVPSLYKALNQDVNIRTPKSCTVLKESLNTYLIMPPVTMPRWGSFQVLNKSWISSSRWACAHTKLAYFVISGQSWEATTCITIFSMLKLGAIQNFLVEVFRFSNAYSSYRWTRIISVFWMSNISSKNYCWNVTDQRNPPT